MKKKCKCSLSSQRNYLCERLIFYRAYNKEEEDKYSQSEFHYPEDLEMSSVENGNRHWRKSGAHRRFYKQTKQVQT